MSPKNVFLPKNIFGLPMQARAYLQQLLSKGKTAETIEQYLLLTQQHQADDAHTSGILQSSRYHDLITQRDQGAISQADYQLELAKINRALATMLAAMPAHWEVDAPNIPTAIPPSPAPAGKSFLEKWGLILGILASIAGILGITLKDVLFPPKETSPATSTNTNLPQSKTEPAPTTIPPPTTRTAPNSVPSGTSSQGPTTAPTEKKTVNQPVTTSPTSATPDQRFRSYAKPLVSEEMELGFTNGGSKYAFRNLRTQAILCCYDDAEKFDGGKARVQQNGRYFYINKNGTEIKE